MTESTSYFRATHHPWLCLLFLFPLLAVYEGGVYLLGGTIRNRCATVPMPGCAGAHHSVKPYLAAPAIIVAVFFWWSIRRWHGARDTMGIYCGMWFESVLFAFGIWMIGYNFGQITKSLGVRFATAEVAIPTGVLSQIITYVGAGIYEEVLFRLFLITGLVALLKYCFVIALAAMPLAVVGSASLFAGAHHFGEFGEPMDPYRFLYRTTAGLYFALLFWWRGFGIAVGAHAVYDVLVGVQLG